MKDKILDALKFKLEASYNEYMGKKYPEELADYKERKKHFPWDKIDPPEARPLTEFYISKTEPYIDKLQLTNDADYITMVDGYKAKVTITIYILTGEGILLKIKTYNGEPAQRIDYIVSRDISKISLERGKIIYVFNYNRRWEHAEELIFDTEDAAYDFYTKLNNHRKRKPSQRH